MTTIVKTVMSYYFVKDAFDIAKLTLRLKNEVRGFCIFMKQLH